MPVSIKDVYVSSANTSIKNVSKHSTVVIDDGDKWDKSSVNMTMLNNQDDNGFSKSVKEIPESRMGSEISAGRASNTALSILHGAGLYEPSYIKNHMYTSTFRYGIANPYTAVTSGREILFFTKPDLHILNVNDTTQKASETGDINTDLYGILKTVPFWVDLYYNRKDSTLKILQNCRDVDHPFNYLLQNQCKSNLDIPGLTSEMIDTPVNDYGVGYSYRGSSEASDDGPEFSLEFKDNRFLDTYYFFKAYEEYETLKHHGVITPPKKYIMNKILHDCFAIYKFIIADDMETILYWGKMYGVVPKSLPRDVFSNPNFDDGLSYSVDFKAAFYEDMRPEILSDFNALGQRLWNSTRYKINQYNSILGRPDTRPAEAAHVVVDTTSPLALMSPAGYVYKLIWKGDSTI